MSALTWEQMQQIRNVVEAELVKLGFTSTGADNCATDAEVDVTKDGKDYEFTMFITEV